MQFFMNSINISFTQLQPQADVILKSNILVLATRFEKQAPTWLLHGNIQEELSTSQTEYSLDEQFDEYR